MFATDGCKISSNCAKEWGGTKKELLKKAEKIATLEKKARKIISWTWENEDRIGRRGKPLKSNITDNESAKLVSSHGVIQGYNGIATVDADLCYSSPELTRGEVFSLAESSPDSPVRQVTKTDRGMRHNTKSANQRMMERFDSERGRYHYSRRMGVVEPVFADTRATLGLDRFSLRGRRKVDAQWKLYCIVHNIGKLARYGPSFAGASG